ncbi:MAG TPA: hypothetical protein VK364_00860, partial [Hymenobacter sp.]|nr:hypothetical protein [Hymenobacter sp.]
MSKPKKAALFLFFAALLGVGYGGAVRGLSFKVLGYRNYAQQLDAAHFAAAAKQFENSPYAKPLELSDFAVAYTADALTFRMKSNSASDPNKILESKHGHCKMYAYVLASTFNQLAKKHNSTSRCRVAYGLVYWYGINLHQFIGGAFFKDHDFNVITDGNRTYAVDATLYDYFRI